MPKSQTSRSTNMDVFTGWTTEPAIAVSQAQLVKRQLGSNLNLSSETVSRFRPATSIAIFFTFLESLTAPLHRPPAYGLRRAAASSVLLLLTISTFGQTAQVGGGQLRAGSVHGTLTTSQADGSGGLAGI